MANRIHKGQSTGLTDDNGVDILAGDRIVEVTTGKTYRVNTYCQAVPEGDGKAVELSSLCRNTLIALVPDVEEEKVSKHETPAETPATRICKCCGRELPLEAFGKNRWGVMSTCQECITRKRKSAGVPIPQKPTTAPAPEAPAAPAPKTECICISLKTATPEELVAELRARGWEVTATKTL